MTSYYINPDGSRGKQKTYKRSTEYIAWRNIRNRCLNPGNISYIRYGGRGIEVCVGILSSFQYFVSLVGEKPDPLMEIDRKNNNANYSCGKCSECVVKGWPLNLRWLTPKENGRNKNNNHLITYKDKTQSIAAWAEELGFLDDRLRYNQFRNRIYAGWTVERIFEQPRRAYPKSRQHRVPVATVDESALRDRESLASLS